MTRTSFFLFFVGNCYGSSLCHLPSLGVWINVVPEEEYFRPRCCAQRPSCVQSLGSDKIEQSSAPSTDYSEYRECFKIQGRH